MLGFFLDGRANAKNLGKRGFLKPALGAGSIEFTQTLQALGITPSSEQPLSTSKLQRKWIQPSSSDVANLSPLKLKVFFNHRTEAERNVLSLYGMIRRMSPERGVTVGSARSRERLRRLYAEVEEALENGHDAKELANGRIFGLRNSCEVMCVLPNGSVIYNDDFLVTADRIGEAVVKAKSEDELVANMKATMTSSPPFTLTESEQQRATSISDGLLKFLIGHELVNSGLRGRSYGVPKEKFVKGYSSRKGRTMTEQQKSELFSDVWGVDLALRTGTRPESILAIALLAKMFAPPSENRNHPTGNERYFFMHQLVHRMTKMKKREYAAGQAPVVKGTYLTEADLEGSKFFPVPQRYPDSRATRLGKLAKGFFHRVRSVFGHSGGGAVSPKLPAGNVAQ